MNYPLVFVHLQVLVNEVKNQAAVPVSVSCQPLNAINIELLAKAGVDRLGIAFDAATEALFEKIKGKDAGSTYGWENQFRLLNQAIVVFGKGNVRILASNCGAPSAAEKEAAQIIQKLVDMTVPPALFAFTPIRGTRLESNSPPPLESYRRVQLMRFLMVNCLVRYEDMHFDDGGKITNFGIASRGLFPPASSLVLSIGARASPPRIE